MIMNNENIKLSRNRKRRIESKIKMDSNMKLSLNRIKTEKEKKIKNFHKMKKLEIELVNIKYANNPKKLQSELKESNKIQVVITNLIEVKQEVLVGTRKFVGYTGKFELVGSLGIGDQNRQTHIRFKIIADSEA